MAFLANAQAQEQRVALANIKPRALAGLVARGRLADTNQLQLALCLTGRDREGLNALVREIYDPQSTNFHRFITPGEFAERFGASEADYAAAIQFAETNGLRVFGTHTNRLVLDVEGAPSKIERAFGVTLRTYRHPRENRDFFAPDTDPSVPANLHIVNVEGLSDFSLPKPHFRAVDPIEVQPQSGSGPSSLYIGKDFRNAYAPNTLLTGMGQRVGLLEFSAYFSVDITNYQRTIGLSNSMVPINNIVIGQAPTTANNAEVALDIEMAIAMAPGLTSVVVYEIRNGPSSILSRMANDNFAKQLSSSWTWSGGPNSTIDTIFLQMTAQGQSYFQASGDSDAYTGDQTLDNEAQTTAPVDNPNITCVGGTSLAMSGAGVSFAAESVWNFHASGGASANVGSGGGISAYYTIPDYQTNIAMTNNAGSTVWRNVPDVAMVADLIYVNYNNGSSGSFSGTSCSAPLWAGFCALVNQQSLASGGGVVGFINPAIYALATTTNYTPCFHDTVGGNNIGTNTPNLYKAAAGFDLCTGLGSPRGTNLINALAPLQVPFFLLQPTNRFVTNGANLTLIGVANGAPPISYSWLMNGTNLEAGGNVSGTANSTLTFTAVTTNNAASYQLVASNSFGVVTSAVAVLSVGFAPQFTLAASNQTVIAGSTVQFATTVDGSDPLSYQWRKNNTNLVNGASILGATSNVLTLIGVTASNTATYSIVATNLYGARTNSASLLVVLPPGLAGPLTNRNVECGGNVTFAVAATGTAPLSYQWTLDGTDVVGATTSSLTLSNIHAPNHIVTLALTNLYGSLTTNATLTVSDSLAPQITPLGANPLFVEFGSGFIDPGATASDACAGPVGVTTTGAVNLSSPGTNLISYTADDGSGNTNTVIRTVIVRDTTPPAVTWSFTNLTLAAITNCGVAMPDVTGTNFILASDLSGNLSVTQSPAATVVLPIGTNLVLVGVRDVFGNTSVVTNTIVVVDQTPPVITSLPQNQTNVAGTSLLLSVTATACTPLSYQWFFRGNPLSGETGSTLALNALTLAAAGEYSVSAHSTGGSVTGLVATLTVQRPQPILLLTSSANPVGYRSGVSFTASLSLTGAIGRVLFVTNETVFDSEAVLAGQSTSISLLSLPRGTNLVTAVYLGDANDLPAINQIEQIVTNHPPVVAPAHYQYIAGQLLNINISDLATNWSDVDGDTLSLAAVSHSANGIVITNQAGTLAYYNPIIGTDEFTATVVDGWGGTNFQTISLQPQAGINPRISAASGNANGSFSLDFSGAPGLTYVLEAATIIDSVTIWTPVATNTFGVSGTWHFNDDQAPGFPNRFYRLRLVP